MKKGDIVFVEKTNYRKDNGEVIKAKIITCGRLYFTLEKIDENNEAIPYIFRNKFSIQDMKEVSNYSSEYKVYLTEKEIQDKIDRPIITEKINYWLRNLTTDNLKELLSLINKNF